MANDPYVALGPATAQLTEDENYQKLRLDEFGRLRTTTEASGIVVSLLNSTTTPLAAGATFQGTGEDVRVYPEITINIFGTPANAPGTFFFEFSPNGTDWDVSVPYTLDGPQSFVPLPLRVVLPYFRVRYVNGSTPQTVFRLTTVFHRVSAKHLTRVINQSIDDNEPIEMVRSINAGKSPNGLFTNLPATGTVSAQSTIIPLAAGATFNGSGSVTDMSGYVAAGVTIKSNVNSASNGIVFQWFLDSSGTILLKESIFTYGSAPNGIAIQVPRNGPYLRIKYTNGGVAQTSFSLSSTLLVTSPLSDVLAISETITDNTAAQIVKSQSVGKQENGAFANVALSNSASIKVAVTDRPSEVRNRTHIHISINRTSLVAAGTTLYTVTAGKTLYIHSISLSMLNTVNSVGEWRLRDSTTVKSAYVLSERAIGASAGSASASPSLPEPMKFSTNVNAIEISGDIEIAGYLIGYEE